MRRSLPLSILALSLAAGPALANPGVFVHTIDDRTVAGELTAVAGGKLTVSVKGTPTVVPLDQVTQVVTTEQQSAATPTGPTATAAPVPQRRKSGGLLSAIFGGGSDDDDEVVTPLPSGPPVAAAPVPKPLPPPTTRTSANVTWKLSLAGGDVLHGAVASWAGPTITVRLSGLPDDPKLDVPAAAVTEMWAGSPEAVAKARAVTVPPGPEDVAYVQKDGEVVAVRGVATGIDADALAFRYDDKDRKIGLGRLVGIAFRGNAGQPVARAFHQTVRTINGDAFSGQWVGLGGKDGSAVALSIGGATLDVPFKLIAGIDCVDGRQVWLSSLTPAAVEQAPYFGRVMPYQLDRGLTGGPITLADGPHAHGVAVHSRCVLTYDLAAAGGFDQFKAKLGFEQPAGHLGRVAAKIVADGKVLWQNADARGDGPAADIDVPVAGARRLVLDVDFGQGQDVGDRVVWADSRLLRAGVQK